MLISSPSIPVNIFRIRDKYVTGLKLVTPFPFSLFFIMFYLWWARLSWQDLNKYIYAISLQSICPGAFQFFTLRNFFSYLSLVILMLSFFTVPLSCLSTFFNHFVSSLSVTGWSHIPLLHLALSWLPGFMSAAPASLLKKRLWHRFFPVNFAKFLRTPFFTEHLWWLLLKIWRSSIFWINSLANSVNTKLQFKFKYSLTGE